METITNSNVRELNKGDIVRVTRPAPHTRGAGCTKSCCTENVEDRQVARVTRFKDGRTRVAFGGVNGFTVAFPRDPESRLVLELLR